MAPQPQSQPQTDEAHTVLLFQDFLPIMAQRLGEDGLMAELYKGFHLLADPSSHTITLRSFKRQAALLGLGTMSDAELREMMSLGSGVGPGGSSGLVWQDSDCGSGAEELELDFRQFCIAVMRSSPSLLEQAIASLDDNDAFLLSLLSGEDDAFL